MAARSLSARAAVIREARTVGRMPARKSASDA